VSVLLCKTESTLTAHALHEWAAPHLPPLKGDARDRQHLDGRQVLEQLPRAGQELVGGGGGWCVCVCVCVWGGGEREGHLELSAAALTPAAPHTRPGTLTTMLGSISVPTSRGAAAAVVLTERAALLTAPGRRSSGGAARRIGAAVVRSCPGCHRTARCCMRAPLERSGF
jgi:hypothetical protein